MGRQALDVNSNDAYRLRIVSLEPIRPENEPDPWERAALNAFNQGRDEVAGQVEVNGEAQMRLIRPLVVEKECLGCHRVHGYCEGERRGGMSISVPLKGVLAAHRYHLVEAGFGFLLIWGLGLGGMFIGQRRLLQQMAAAERGAEQLDEAEKNIHYLTFHDPLTGLPNRHLFGDRLQVALAQHARNDAKLAIGVLGIDQYKKLKNTFGYQIGEELLKGAVARISGVLRQADTLATMADGRFLLLLTALRRPEDVGTVAQKIREALAPPLLVDGREFFITATLGISLSPDDGIDGKTLISCADAAFSRAKALGRSSLSLYTPSLNQRALEQITLENNLRRALERNQLELFYQPQVDAREGRMSGAEALLRWRCPELGLIAPDEFIPLAEESGLIFAIGEWVLMTACRDAAAWKQTVAEPLTLSVNISVRQFQQSDLVATVDAALAASGLDPQCLVLEITEGTIVQDVERAVRVLNALKERRVRIAIDDFGTGYSALNYLKSFPIDQVKIDKSFVFDIHQRDNSNIIISAIITMAHRMDMDLVAEGVETEAQREYLLSQGCTTMQGYFYSRPVPKQQFLELITMLNAGDSEVLRWWAEPGREPLS
jgi:diguanylate cyclase (GGDEF)-like protein